MQNFRLSWNSWSESNPEDFHPSDIRKNEGRGERRYVWELRCRGVDASLNMSGQNPDIVIGESRGIEIKELDKGWGIRFSGAEEVKFAVYDHIIEPFLKKAEATLSPLLFRKFKILGYISQNPLKALGDIDCRKLFRKFFEHSGIDRLVLVSREGYIEMTSDDVNRYMRLNKLNGLVPSLVMKKECRPQAT